MPRENPLPSEVVTLLTECRRVIVNLKSDVPEGFTDCGGSKCRQSNCEACHGVFAEEYDTKDADAAIAAIDAFLKKEVTG